ncbi:protein-methionine-sulfoxide reductase heme-binding subunit MsrQ [Xinfangfangia sp. CPCC 101601]|uniref:Protein-methionine-sulfoxide reductase heme-binding subunit MsrQ n=1 Tax=Pseudogemmobacter lacusdianii TaxID=3069608 RepID=A0ABU0W2D6_9RHOB|nr:protein-methionine-sulfoxide reductase heme-binding subunit MsrQ [Xinfangfangia sp. CPCC 101601]MDQ2068176.1 protein-methionine-sulfoxide reductase heme-binding subunit MsrQ [Xinfangfangia sp. CPCC 101601]
MTAVLDVLNAQLRRLPSWAVYSVGALPVLWLAYLTVRGQLGPDPAKVMERELGLWALRFLLASLAVTPLRRLGLNLMKHRRALGLLCFIYAALHLTIWLWPDMGLRWPQIWADLVQRPYILFGMVGFLCLMPLAVTSSNAAIRWMGAGAWRRLHRLAYPALALAVLHFVTLSRIWTVELLIYAALAVLLLVLRMPIPLNRRARREG